jgi:hypothetical protein
VFLFIGGITYAKVTTEDFKAVRPDIYTEEVTVSVAY